MKQINYNDIEIFRKNLSTFKETSMDSDGASQEYMVSSEALVVNFDKVKEQYCRELHVVSPCSCDAFYVNAQKKCFLVEFKNGKLDKSKVFHLHRKIYDSLLILNDIIQENISFCRQQVSFVLVYNEEKNPKADIGKYFSKKANKPFVRWGLESFQGLYFQAVLTFTVEEFNDFLRE